MRSRISRCDVVEIAEGAEGTPDLAVEPKDLLPWADPYVAAVLRKHRLQAALDDSLIFVQRESIERDLIPPKPVEDRPRRFVFPGPQSMS
ncbi:MAG TPA: hypothetical protein VFW87_26740 [Pirellulales bacterium]|nr:hypothetical protein [Pirellulales bacterium]